MEADNLDKFIPFTPGDSTPPQSPTGFDVHNEDLSRKSTRTYDAKEAMINYLTDEEMNMPALASEATPNADYDDPISLEEDANHVRANVDAPTLYPSTNDSGPVKQQVTQNLSYNLELNTDSNNTIDLMMDLTHQTGTHPNANELGDSGTCYLAPSAIENATPDLTRGGQMHEVPELRALYDSYHQGYSDPSATLDSHLERANALAHTLLRYLYPASQGFVVEPESFRQMSAYGWSIEEIPNKPVNKNNRTKDKCGGRRVTVEERPPNPWPDYEERYHFIPPECISGFVVKRVYSITEEDGTTCSRLFPHTYLAIMVDDLKTLEWWKTTKHQPTNLRGDIMSHSLAMDAKIARGYGIVIVGPRVEFYRYDFAKARPMSDFAIPSTRKKYAKQEAGNYAFDMRTADPKIVANAFETIATQGVHYQNGRYGRPVEMLVQKMSVSDDV